MKANLWRLCAAVLISTLPGWIMLIFFSLLIGTKQYGAVSYRLWALSFLFVSGGVAAVTIVRSKSRSIGFWRRILLTTGSAGWLVSLFVFAAINATPLCVGQDNGDGNNTLSHCFVETVLAGMFYSIPAMFLVMLTSHVVAPMLIGQQSRVDEDPLAS